MENDQERPSSQEEEASPEEHRETPGQPDDGPDPSEREPVSEERPTSEPEGESEDEGSGCGKILLGCGGALGILLVVLVIVLYFSWGFIVNKIAQGATKMITATIEDSQLPDDQKKQLKNRVEKLSKKYQEGKISTEQLKNITGELRPLINVGMVQYVNRKHVQTSELPEDKKKQGKRTLERFARGLHENQLNSSDLETVMDPITEKTGENDMRQFKKDPSTEEIKTVLKRARKKVEEKEIPDESFQLNIANEFDRIVDEELKKSDDAGSGGGTNGSMGY